jgi:hypothetical protein
MQPPSSDGGIKVHIHNAPILSESVFSQKRLRDCEFRSPHSLCEQNDVKLIPVFLLKDFDSFPQTCFCVHWMNFSASMQCLFRQRA